MKPSNFTIPSFLALAASTGAIQPESSTLLSDLSIVSDTSSYHFVRPLPQQQTNTSTIAAGTGAIVASTASLSSSLMSGSGSETSGSGTTTSASAAAASTMASSASSTSSSAVRAMLRRRVFRRRRVRAGLER
ncbi:hypothetical protein LTR08_001024 [Meristemomyces frigidus]|nr:hypothetical protein LTR08_001024 [Meristemomyces frigidus]